MIARFDKSFLEYFLSLLKYTNRCWDFFTYMSSLLSKKYIRSSLCTSASTVSRRLTYMTVTDGGVAEGLQEPVNASQNYGFWSQAALKRLDTGKAKPPRYWEVRRSDTLFH